MSNSQNPGLPDGWISQGEKWTENLPSLVKKTAQNEFKLPASILNTLLPSPNISLKALAEFTLPVTVEKPTMRKYIENYFTVDPSTPITPAVLMRLQHLPMPERSTIRELVEVGHQAWLNGARSVQYAHLSEDSKTTTRFPLWTITFWNQVLDTREVSQKWVKCVDWVMVQLRQKKSEERQLLAEQAMIHISALPWAVKKPKGLSDNEPIHTLWRYLSTNWLSGSNQNDLLELLRHQLAGWPDIAKTYRVGGTRVTDKLLEVYRKRDIIQYTKDQSLGWLRMLANDLIKNQATLVTVQNLTNVTGSPHWVSIALRVATDEYTLLFGDSLGDKLPEELQKAYTWWMAQHDVIKNTDNLIAVNHLPIASQTDGHACGILAINALHHFIDPHRSVLNSGSTSDVIKERLQLFNLLSSNIIRRVSNHIITKPI